MPLMLSTPLGNILLRPTQPSDAAALRELRLEALWMHPEAFSADHDTNLRHPPEFWIERCRAGAGGESQVLLVALREGGELCGMCGLRQLEGSKIEHLAEIWGVYVRPAWRGLGLANAMLDACERWARGRGVRLIRLEVVTTNTAAIRCYQRRGFVPFGTAPQAIRHHGVTYDELLMAKSIAAPATGAGAELS